MRARQKGWIEVGERIIFQRVLLNLLQTISAANKYYSFLGHHEQKNKKTTDQIKFLAVTIKQSIKLVLRHSLCKNEFNALVQVLPLHSFIFSISCLIKKHTTFIKAFAWNAKRFEIACVLLLLLVLLQGLSEISENSEQKNIL